MALILRAGISPLCPPHPCGCALLHGSEASPLCHLQSLPTKGLPSVWKPFLLHSSLPLVQVLSLFFCLCFFFFLLPYPGTWGVSCLWGGLRSSASIQKVFCRSCSTCRCISDVFVERKVISTSYSSAIFPIASYNQPGLLVITCLKIPISRFQKLCAPVTTMATAFIRCTDKFRFTPMQNST